MRVIVSSIRTNRARCALHKKILDLLDEENVSGESSGRLVYKFDKKSYLECLKGESIAKERFKEYFGPQTYIYIYIYIDTNTDHFTSLALRANKQY